MENSKASPPRTKFPLTKRKGYFNFESKSELPITVTRFSTVEFDSYVTTMIALSYHEDYSISTQFSERVLTFGNVNIYFPLSFYPQETSSLAHKEFYCAVTRNMELFFTRRGLRLQAKKRNLVFEITGSGIPSIPVFASLFSKIKKEKK